MRSPAVDDRAGSAAVVLRSQSRVRGGLIPPFFQNLRPEGALREPVEKEFGTGNFDNFDVLAKLGSDLPGATVARQETGNVAGARFRSAERERRPEAPLVPGRIRFSLAGLQLKFSVLAAWTSAALPARGTLGNVILRTRSWRVPGMPELEYSGNRMIRAVGVETPECWLVDPERVEGAPEEFLAAGPASLAMRRFEGAPRNRRIQIELFAQIAAPVGDQKYTKGNEESVLNVVRRFSTDSLGGVLEGVRRSVANVLIGNGDAHLKNWSFTYPEDGSVRLTPAYDVIPICHDDTRLAVAFGGTLNPGLIDMHRYGRLAGLLKVRPPAVHKEVMSTVEAALDLWPSLMNDLPLTDGQTARITRRWDKLALVSEAVPRHFPAMRKVPTVQAAMTML